MKRRRSKALVKPSKQMCEEQEDEIPETEQPERMQTDSDAPRSGDESAHEDGDDEQLADADVDNGIQSAGSDGDADENESAGDDENGDENGVGDADEVDFSKLTGIGVCDEDDSDMEEALRVVNVSELPAQTLSLARNDEAALDAALGRVALFDTAGRHGQGKLPFRESLSVCHPAEEATSLPAALAANDLDRERKFAELATGAVHDALARLRVQKIKFRRPDDYFAQMIKSDGQMTRVKAHMLAQRDAIKNAEKRKHERGALDGKKERKAQRLAAQERNKKMKEEIEATTKLRKQRVKQREEKNIDSDDEFPIDVLDAELLDPESKQFATVASKSKKKVHWKNVDEQMDKPNRGGRKFNKGDGRNAGNRKSGGPAGPSGINKKRGPKKRLGKNRRKTAAAKVGSRA